MNAKRLLCLLAAMPCMAGSFTSAFGPTPALAQSQALPAPTVRPAVDGIMAAFATHPLVGLAETTHGMAQEDDVYAAVIRDPRFAREVGNVVVEFGGAVHQGILDRYLAGETVPYTELRKVWTDVVGWNAGAVVHIGYLYFFARVRAVNLGLPPEQRIRVWLGEPPIDWSKIQTRADLEPYGKRRDSHAADLIKREILAKKKKALVIYGSAHLDPKFDVPPVLSAYFFTNLRSLVEKDYPDAFFVARFYSGLSQKACSAEFERGMRDWPVPALATPVARTNLATALLGSGCSALPPPPPPIQSALQSLPEEQRRDFLRKIEEIGSGIAADALLYVGPSATLVFSRSTQDVHLDLEYRKELERRSQIIFGRPLSTMMAPETPRLVRP